MAARINHQELAYLIALALHPPTKYCTDNAARCKAEATILEVLQWATTPQVTPQLKDILKQYGAHHIRDCDALNKWKKLPCDCGFAALIEGTSEQAPQEREKP